jgi:four helix bundle protein
LQVQGSKLKDNDMTTAKRFEDLEVWQKAKELTNLVYKYSSDGVFARDFGLRDQMRRAAVSIMSNIAEGFESQTQAMFIKYLAHAKGSAGELRAQLYMPEIKDISMTMDLIKCFHLLKHAVNNLPDLFNIWNLNPMRGVSAKKE